MDFRIPLVFAILPFLLWPVEVFLPYPSIVEEFTKAAAVYWAVSAGATGIAVMILGGFLFAISETVLYLFNIQLVGDAGVLFLRLGSTSLLHIATILVMFFLARRQKWLVLPGLGAAILIHYLYNLYIAL